MRGISSDQPIDVFYYQIRLGLPEEQRAREIYERACAFAQRARAFANTMGADGWVRTVDDFAYSDRGLGQEWRGHRLHSLRFANERTVPPDWQREKFGTFIPGERVSAALRSEFRSVVTPVEALLVEPVGEMGGRHFSVRFHVMKDRVLVAAESNMDGTRPIIPWAEALTIDQVEEIKRAASPEDMKGFSLNHYSWSVMDQAYALHSGLSAQDGQRLSHIERERSRGRTDGYVPNPTTGARGWGKWALEGLRLR